MHAVLYNMDGYEEHHINQNKTKEGQILDDFSHFGI